MAGPLCLCMYGWVVHLSFLASPATHLTSAVDKCWIPTCYTSHYAFVLTVYAHACVYGYDVQLLPGSVNEWVTWLYSSLIYLSLSGACHQVTCQVALSSLSPSAASTPVTWGFLSPPKPVVYISHQLFPLPQTAPVYLTKLTQPLYVSCFGKGAG